MKPVILLLAATALIGAARPQPPRHEAPYEAGGFEPSWQLEISNGRLTYDPGQAKVEPIRIPLPSRQAQSNGYLYVSPGLIVDVRHERCEAYGGRIYSDTVRVTGVREAGCGGRLVAPDMPKATSWEIGTIGGRAYQQGEAHLNFAYDNVLRGTVGCSTFSVPFFEHRPLVRFGRMTVTRRDCPALSLERERRVLEIFSGTSRISFVDGDTLILTGRYGSVRLLP